MIEEIRLKICTRCKTEKQIDEFSKNKNTNDGHQYWCKECENQYRDMHRKKCIDCKKIISRGSLRCHRCAGLELAKDPIWHKRNADILVKRNKQLAQDPEWRKHNKEANRKSARDPNWIKKNAIDVPQKRRENPKYVENKLISKTGQGFWYGHPTLRKWNNGKNIPLYCELFKEVDPRVRAFQGNTCLLCGITEEENGMRHGDHHIFYEKKTCCWIDDNGEYWTNLNARDHKEKDYYIGENPNYFALLCNECHMSTGGNFENRKQSADKLRNIIDTRFNGKSYYTEEEMIELGYIKIGKYKWAKK